MLANQVNTGSIFASGQTTTGQYTYYVTSTENSCESEATVVTLTINALPLVSFSGLDSYYCEDAFPDTLTGSPPNGIFLGDGIIDSILYPSDLNLGINEITYSYTDLNGCKDSVTQEFTIYALPVPNAGEDEFICFGDSHELGTDSIPGHSYQWISDPVGFVSSKATPEVSPEISTTYVLTETIDATGCLMTDTVYITVNELPNPNAGVDHSICLGDSHELGTDSIPGNSYQWISDPVGFVSSEATPEVSPEVNTAYILTETISATGCSIQDSVNITVNELPLTNAGEDEAVCHGSDVVLGTDDTEGYSYQWTSSPPGHNYYVANPLVKIWETTSFYLTKTDDETGCFDIDTVLIIVYDVVDLPVCEDVLVCEGETVPDFVAEGTNIRWYDDEELTHQVGYGLTYNPGITAIGNYPFYVTQTVGDCESTGLLVYLHIYPQPGQLSVDDISICFNEEMQAFYADGDSIRWYDSNMNLLATGNSFIPDETNVGIYTYYVTQTTNICESQYDTVMLKIIELPDLPVSNDETACSGSVIPDLVATGNSIEWFDEDTLLVHEGDTCSTGETNPGIYTYYVTQTVNTCRSEYLEVTLTINETPDPPVVYDTTMCEGEQVPYLYVIGENVIWYSDQNLQDSIYYGNYYYSVESETGTYTYYVTQTANDCESDYSAVSLTINEKPEVGITNPDDLDYVYEEGSIILAASGANTYEWFSEYGDEDLPDQQSVQAHPTHAKTIYSVIGTKGGCTDTAEYTVYIHCPPCENSTSVYSFAEPYSTINHGCEDFYYTHNLNCEWRVEPEGISSIHYYFNKFKVHQSDWIRIYSGIEVNSENLISEFNNENLPPAISEELFVSRMLIVFETNDSLVDEGFLLKLSDEPIPVNIDPVSFDNSFINIFPNPAQGEITLSYNGLDSKIIEVKVFDMIGSIIEYNSYETNYEYFEENLNVNNLREGLYFIEILTEQSKYVKKVLIK